MSGQIGLSSVTPDTSHRKSINATPGLRNRFPRGIVQITPDEATHTMRKKEDNPLVTILSSLSIKYHPEHNSGTTDPKRDVSIYQSGHRITITMSKIPSQSNILPRP
ncbi:hypothetical protein T310_1904 [Rasamsonia emersonii CBS 393.64]|uniref:Uncharacterized protein n=1 Tax=Rasamsonia emersonii (strain ATCC 16479 / CBS 393.64 / IMI 116815) TaxID=1408163 RepID=A0A0F4Z0N6_RASE3|nr:hypothetical protein T310_1904 [Rasamsonia emersonii CBS 393.64]KKA24092.1 hypothetical protein T310_1904 [Rasamsonia emersonii CBS 393.64]